MSLWNTIFATLMLPVDLPRQIDDAGDKYLGSTWDALKHEPHVLTVTGLEEGISFLAERTYLLGERLVLRPPALVSGARPGQLAAQSTELSQASVMRDLRQSGTPNALMQFGPARAATDAADILAALRTKHYNALVADPSKAAQYLSEAEQLAGPRFNAANFGKALERAVGADVQQNYSHVLKYVGGPNNPDFVGVGAAAGRTFDITTFNQQASHYARPYGSTLELILYQTPKGWP
jgi:hypothetical protein